jgi:hypothetical protein
MCNMLAANEAFGTGTCAAGTAPDVSAIASTRPAALSVAGACKCHQQRMQAAFIRDVSGSQPADVDFLAPLQLLDAIVAAHIMWQAVGYTAAKDALCVVRNLMQVDNLT